MDAFERIAQTMQQQMGNTYNANSTVTVELGSITSNLDLKVSRFDTPIPKGEYLIDKRLAINYKPDIEVITSISNNHRHNVTIPLTEGIARIRPNDTVLVCWVGIDPVIVAVLVNSSDIGKET